MQCVPQFNGGHVDEKVDVYSWACIVNECLTRRPPWGDLNFFQVLLTLAGLAQSSSQLGITNVSGLYLL